MAAPFTASIKLSVGSDVGLPTEEFPVDITSTYTSKEEKVLNFTGAGTSSVNLGTVASAGAKLLLVKLDATSGAAAVTVAVNGATPAQEVAPGGVLLVVSPSPVAGATTLSITRTTSCTIRVWVLS